MPSFTSDFLRRLLWGTHVNRMKLSISELQSRNTIIVGVLPPAGVWFLVVIGGTHAYAYSATCATASCDYCVEGSSSGVHGRSICSLDLCTRATRLLSSALPQQCPYSEY